MKTEKYSQIVDCNGEFSIKIEQMPLNVRSAGINVLTLAVISIFLIISIFFLSKATGNLNSFYTILLTVLFSLIAGYSFFYESFSLTISSEKITFLRRGAFFFPRVSWEQRLSDYTYVAGRRYYGFFPGFDAPRLVREISLHHSNDRYFDVVLCRFFADDVENIDQTILWQNEWHKACVLLEKAPVDIIDGKLKKIDIAQIVAASGDGGASKGSYR